jgi:hypothetical protein
VRLTMPQDIQDRVRDALLKHELANPQPVSAEARARAVPDDLPRSRIPLTIVCGAPASGKSYLVEREARPGDIVIDLDQIFAHLGRGHGHSASRGFLEEALDRRNAMLRDLARPSAAPRAWFIVCASDPAERDHWATMLGGEIRLVLTPLEECVRRIKADSGRRQRRSAQIAAAVKWWARNADLLASGATNACSWCR